MVYVMNADAAWEPGRPLLAHVAQARRKRLGITRQADVSRHGGPSVNTVRRIELNEPVELTHYTLGKLDTALSWPAGTAECLQYGTDPQAVAEWNNFISVCINDTTSSSAETISGWIERAKVTSMSDEISQVNSYLLFADYHLACLKAAATSDQEQDIHVLEESIHDARSIVFRWLRAARKDN